MPSINELMRGYLQDCQVANSATVTASAGMKSTVFAETRGGEGYSVSLSATAWGELNGEPAILLKLKGGTVYVLSYATYNEICNLLRRDLSDCDVITDFYRSGAHPGQTISIQPSGGSLISATAWYEIPPGDIKVFLVDGKRYAISLVAPKTIRTTNMVTKRNNRSDNLREIVWREFGSKDSDFPRKLEYLI